MEKPRNDKRVLAWVKNEDYPFVGFWNGNEWWMETNYLNADTFYSSDIFGEVVCWQELPTRTC